ncbi:MAG: helix-turn-helix transcriptional regulator [Agathobacter sp.]|nr:helix-turn-helix transcriptional regulator [Agathobacter sp.]
MVYARIRNLREDKDLTQAELANHLNISQRTYSRYENDERSIPIEILSKLADYHKTSIDYLIGRTDHKKPYPPSINLKKTIQQKNTPFR